MGTTCGRKKKNCALTSTGLLLEGLGPMSTVRVAFQKERVGSTFAIQKTNTMRDKDESYYRFIREYEEVLTDIVASNAELKKMGKDFIEFGKDLINRREALSFDKEKI